MSERLVIPPGIINNTIIKIESFWNEKTESFESADTVAEVADAPPASDEKLESLGISFVLERLDTSIQRILGVVIPPMTNYRKMVQWCKTRDTTV